MVSSRYQFPKFRTDEQSEQFCFESVIVVIYITIIIIIVIIISIIKRGVTEEFVHFLKVYVNIVINIVSINTVIRMHVGMFVCACMSASGV